jgi:hypothetical protein
MTGKIIIVVVIVLVTLYTVSKAWRHLRNSDDD